MVVNRCWTIFLLSLVFSFMVIEPVFAREYMAIRANNGQRQVMAMQNKPLDVTIELESGIFRGLSADWWLLAETDLGVFHYSLDGSWAPGRAVSYQGPLFDFPATPVLSTNGLPPGTYKIKFALDAVVDGTLNENNFSDEVDVTIVPFTCPENPTDSLTALSSIQQRFLTTRGNPDIFMVGFSSEELDSNGQVVFSENIRRIDSWVYNNTEMATIVFDSGHFVKETTREAVSPLLATTFSPSQFTYCMTKEDIVALMGQPSCILNEEMGGRSYEYLRYNPTQDRAAAMVVLENGLLTNVTAGFTLDYPDFSTQCPLD